MSSLEIDTAGASAEVGHAITRASQSLTALASSAVYLGRRFGQGEGPAASADLRRLVEAIRALTVLTRAIAAVIEAKSAAAGHTPVVDDGTVTADVTDALRELRDWQARQDWTMTARCLERRLAPALLGWRKLFDRFDRLREAA